MKRFLLLVVVALLGFAAFRALTPKPPAALHPACASPPLRSVEKRQQALEDGYEVLPGHDCISKVSYDAIEEEKRRHAQAQRERAQVPAASAPTPPATLAEARQGFNTQVGTASTKPSMLDARPLPKPPASLFVRSDYRSGALELAAFVTPDPRDGRRHPAIVWLTGGDTNSLSEFWDAGPESVQAFREAGLVVMFPTLRGGNGGPGSREWLLGEADDAIAAGEHVAALPYVDPKQVYLGGHSVGGTLALLAAANGTSRFRSVFAFGPVSDVTIYPPTILPVRWDALDRKEAAVRSPVNWLAGIATPTYLIEGARGNDRELRKLCAANRNPAVRCIEVPREDHFTVLPRVTKTIAARMVMASEGIDFKLAPEDFTQ